MDKGAKHGTHVQYSYEKYLPFQYFKDGKEILRSEPIVDTETCIY